MNVRQKAALPERVESERKLSPRYSRRRPNNSDARANLNGLNGMRRLFHKRYVPELSAKTQPKMKDQQKVRQRRIIPAPLTAAWSTVDLAEMTLAGGSSKVIVSKIMMSSTKPATKT
jgi:hypothetical protein